MITNDEVSRDIIGKSFTKMVEKYKPLGFRILVCEDTGEDNDDYNIYYEHTFEVVVKEGLITKIYCFHEKNDHLIPGDSDW